MKKAAKVEYGIEIVKPWSKAMYDHNDAVADQVRDILNEMLQEFRDTLDPEVVSKKNDDLQNFGTRVCGHGGWIGFKNELIIDQIGRVIEDAPYYYLREIVDTLALQLEKGFVGF